MLQHSPTMLLLNEFQYWYDGLTNPKYYPSMPLAASVSRPMAYRSVECKTRRFINPFIYLT